MNNRKIEALRRLRTPGPPPPRLPALSQPHHFQRVSRMTDSLFDCGDGIALLQHVGVIGGEGVLLPRPSPRPSPLNGGRGLAYIWTIGLTSMAPTWATGHFAA